MAADLANPVPPPYKDRRGWLIAFGVLEILFAIFCLMLVVLVILVFTLPQFGNLNSSPQQHATQAAGLISAIVVYGSMAAMFLTIGVGSVGCRNWARIAMIVVSGSWLCMGVISTLGIALLFPEVMSRQNGVSPQAAHTAVVVMVVLMGALMVAMPSLLLFFYTRPSVRATCLARKTSQIPPARAAILINKVKPAGVPTPLIVLAVWQGLGVFSVFGFLMVRSTVIFGVVLHGLAAFSVLFSVAALSGYAAWAIYQRQALGWFLAVALTLYRLASIVATFAGRDMLQVFRDMGMREEQIQVFYMFPQMRWIIWISIVSVTTAYLALLVYTWKFFSRATPEAGWAA